MTEGEVGIPKPKESGRDKLVDLKVKYLQAQPDFGRFLKGSLNNIKEAIGLIIESSELGGVIDKEINPFGEGITKLALVVIGDLHIAGSEPQESIESRSPVFSKIEKISPRSRESRSRDRSWSHDERPILSVKNFRRVSEAVIGSVENLGEFFGERSTMAIVDLGDRGNPESTAEDIALTAIELEMMRQRVEKMAVEVSGNGEAKVRMSILPGNHDNDPFMKGLRSEDLERGLWGSQIFLQEVGDEYVILGVNTNFYSSFWHKYFNKSKDRIDNKMGELSKREVIKGVEEEYQRQEELIKKSLDSGKKIVVIGHEEKNIKQAIDLKKSKVTHVISGDLHKEAVGGMGIKNKDGDEVERIRIGYWMKGWLGFEESQDSTSYVVKIDSSKKAAVQVDKLKLKKD